MRAGGVAVKTATPDPDQSRPREREPRIVGRLDALHTLDRCATALDRASPSSRSSSRRRSFCSPSWRTVRRASSASRTARWRRAWGRAPRGPCALHPVATVAMRGPGARGRPRALPRDRVGLRMLAGAPCASRAPSRCRRRRRGACRSSTPDTTKGPDHPEPPHIPPRGLEARGYAPTQSQIWLGLSSGAAVYRSRPLGKPGSVTRRSETLGPSVAPKAARGGGPPLAYPNALVHGALPLERLRTARVGRTHNLAGSGSNSATNGARACDAGAGSASNPGSRIVANATAGGRGRIRAAGCGPSWLDRHRDRHRRPAGTPHGAATTPTTRCYVTSATTRGVGSANEIEAPRHEDRRRQAQGADDRPAASADR
jgi:hypothetical protein